MAGQIIKRGERTWLVRIFLGRDEKGKRQYLNKTIHGTKADAQRYAREKERDKDLGLCVEPSIISVNTYLDQWLASITKQVRPNSHEWYTRALKSYVRPTLGNLKLSQVQPRHIQALYTALQNHLAARTVRHVRGIVNAAFNQAVTLRMIAQNPAAGIKTPPLVRKEMHTLSPEEAARFCEAAKADEQQGVAFVFALLTGLRPEEYIGLQWSCLELEHLCEDGQRRGVVHVRRTVVAGKGNRGWYWGAPKSPKSRRSVYFPVWLSRELAEHRKRQNEWRMRMRHIYQDHDLVFATKTGTPHDRNHLTVRHFKPILKRAGVSSGFRLYDLRHSFVTLSLLAGIDVKTISEQAGHASVAFTLDNYAHVLPRMQHGASDKLDTILWNRAK